MEAVQLPSAIVRNGVTGQRIVTLFLPRPTPHSSSNSRSHWREAAPHKAAQRLMAKTAAQMVGHISFTHARIVFRYVNGKRVPGEYAPHDHQNAGAALKASVDGIADSGLIPQDSKRCVVYFGGEIVTEKGGQSRVEIDIEEVWL